MRFLYVHSAGNKYIFKGPRFAAWLQKLFFWAEVSGCDAALEAEDHSRSVSGLHYQQQRARTVSSGPLTLYYIINTNKPMCCRAAAFST